MAKDKGSGASGRGNGAGGKRRADQSREGRGRTGGAASGGKPARRTGDKDGKGRSSGRRGAPARRQDSAATSIAKSGSSQLPKWVREELIRVTPKTRAKSALEALEEAAASFAAGQYHRALRQAESAKKLSSRDATTREILALSAYRVGNWDLALRELRTYRRMTGDPVHLPVEMDVLRALDRPDEVHRSWADLRRLGGPPASQKEGKVVYASFLLDRGDIAQAWEVAKPGRLHDDPYEEDLRVWYVAARAAAHLGDEVTARRLLEAITVADPGFPGLTELRLGDLRGETEELSVLSAFAIVLSVAIGVTTVPPAPSDPPSPEILAAYAGGALHAIPLGLPDIRPVALPALNRGTEGPLVAELQVALEEAGFRPGSTDGTFGRGTQQAVLAFQKHHGLERDGVFRPEQWQMLEEHVTIRWLPEPDRIEVDIAKQVLYLVLDNHVSAVLPISSGNGRSYTNSRGGTSVATTPEGRFRFYSQRNYNHESKLGWMYKPYYFNGGFAIHGSPNVPAYPASHGCIRVTNSDMDFLRQYLEIGMPVYLYGRRTDPPEFAIESRWKAPEPA